MSVTDRTASRTDEPAAQGDAVVTVRHARLRPSNVTLKVVMAVTGTIFALFVLVHMIGNLKALMGPEEFNSYARFLRVLA
ncbi:MAG: succinate dehydrogenase, partial [Acidipropionibacterium jensenii]|nr:succinate dehydrogenase [Acidipropionibacterium jensenii]